MKTSLLAKPMLLVLLPTLCHAQLGGGDVNISCQQNSTPGGGTTNTCPSGIGKPFCHQTDRSPIPNNSGPKIPGKCYKCVNKDPDSSGVHQGCSVMKPHCRIKDADLSSPSKNHAGDVCVYDISTACVDKSRNGVDYGCTDTLPVCLDIDGEEVRNQKEGLICAACVHTQNSGKHIGCPSTSPVCAGPNSAPLLSDDQAGQQCVVCVNTHQGDYTVPDKGCPANRPKCVNDQGDSPAFNRIGTACSDPFRHASLTGCHSGVEHTDTRSAMLMMLWSRSLPAPISINGSWPRNYAQTTLKPRHPCSQNHHMTSERNL